MILNSTGDNLLRSLSVSPKKWADLISELSELSNGANVGTAMDHLISEVSSLIFTESNKSVTREEFSEADSKRIYNYLARCQGALSTPKSSEKNPKIFHFINVKLCQKLGEDPIVNSLQMIPYFNFKYGRRKNMKNKQNGEVEDFLTALIGFIEFAADSSNLHSYLTLLKLLLCMWDDEEMLSLDHSTVDRLVDLLNKNTVIDSTDLQKISREEEYMERLKTFQSVPRIVLSSGQPSKFSTFEVQGKSVGYVSSISVKPDRGEPVYFEATLKGRGFSGIRIGWGVCGSATNPLQGPPGNTRDAWVFEGLSEHFFHDAVAVSKDNRSRARDDASSPSFNLIDNETVAKTGLERAESDGDYLANLFSEEADQTASQEAEAPTDSAEVNLNSLFSTPPSAEVRTRETTTDAETNVSATFPPAPMSSEAPVHQGQVNVVHSEVDRDARSLLAFLREEDGLDILSIRRLLMARGISLDAPNEESSGEQDSISRLLPTPPAVSSKNATSEGSKKLESKHNNPERESRIRVALRGGGLPLTPYETSTEKESNTKKGPSTSTEEYSWTAGSVLGCLLMPVTGEMKFYVNGKCVGVAPKNLSESSNWGEVQEKGVCPVFSCNSSAGLEINVGQAPFKFQEQVLNSLPTPTVVEPVSSPNSESSSPREHSTRVETEQKLSLLSCKNNSFLLVKPQLKREGDNACINTFLSPVSPFEGKSSVASASGKSGGSGVLLSSLTSDSFKSVTFEAGVRLDIESDGLISTNVKRKKGIDPETSESSTEISTAKRFVFLSCAPTCNNGVNEKNPNTSFFASSTEDNGCAIGVDSDGRIFFDINNCGAQVKTQTGVFTFGLWQYVSVVYTYHRTTGKGNVSFLLNGELVGQHEIMGNKKTKIGKILPKYLCIGGLVEKKLKDGESFGSAANPISVESGWVGGICEVRLWTAARSFERIASTIGRGKISGVELDLLSLVPLEEGIGKQVHDIALLKNTVKPLNQALLLGDCTWETFLPVSDSTQYSELFSLETGTRSPNTLLLIGQSEYALRQLQQPNVKSDKEKTKCVKTSKLMAVVMKKLLCASEKFLEANAKDTHTRLSLRKFQYCMTETKGLVEPSEVNLLLIDSLLRQIITGLKGFPVRRDGARAQYMKQSPTVQVMKMSKDHATSEHSTAALSTPLTLCVTIFQLMRANFSAIVDAKDVPTSLGTSYTMLSEQSKTAVSTKLTVCLLFFISGALVDSEVSEEMQRVLREEAIATFVAGLDVLIPEPNNQFFLLESLMQLRNHIKQPTPLLPSTGKTFGQVSGAGFHQDTMSLLIRCGIEEFKKEVLPSDPLVALFSLNQTGAEALLHALCSHFASNLTNAIKLVPENLRPVSKSSGPLRPKAGHLPISSMLVVPKPGDVVKRGPDWRYADQDGSKPGLEAFGVILEVGAWLKQEKRGVLVAWMNGTQNWYRWGVPGNPSSSEITGSSVAEEKLLFDVSVFRSSKEYSTVFKKETEGSDSKNVEDAKGNIVKSGSSMSLSSANSSSSSDFGDIVEATPAVPLNPPSEKKGEFTRRELAYTPEDVTRSLLNPDRAVGGGSGGGGLTKRAVLLYIKENSPVEWQEKTHILKSLNSLLAKLNTHDIAQIYSEFYRTFSSRFTNGGSSVKANASLLKIEPRQRAQGGTSYSSLEAYNGRLTRFLSQLLKDHASEPGGKEFLGIFLTLQAILVVDVSKCECVGGDDSEIQLAETKDRLVHSSFRTKQGKEMVWNWKKGSWGEKGDLPCVDGEDMERKSRASSAADSVKLLTNLNVDKNYLAGGNLVIKTRSRSVEIVQSGDREWNTCICSTPLYPHTGVYQWVVKIKNISERRGHCMIGVATSEFSCDEFLGQDQESWGLSPNLDLFHGGRKRRTDSDRKLTAGSVIEVSLDTNRGVLQFTELYSENNSSTSGKTPVKLTFENVKGMIVFPAFSLYSPADSVQLLTNIDDIETLRSRTSALTSARTGSGSDTVKQVTFLGAPQPIVVDLCLSLIEAANALLPAVACSPSSVVQDNNLLSVSLPHLLASFFQWEFLPKYRAKEMLDTLISFIDHLKSTISQIREHSVSVLGGDSPVVEGRARVGGAGSSPGITNDDLLVQLSCVASACVSRIVKEWILRRKGSIDNHRLALESSVSSPPFDTSTVQLGVFQFDPVSGASKSSEKSPLFPPKNVPENWLKNMLFSEGFKEAMVSTKEPADELLNQVYREDRAVKSFLQWVSLHDKTHKNYRRFGGDALNLPIHMLFIVNLFHSGFLPAANQARTLLSAQLQSKTSEEIEPTLKALKPPHFLTQCWESAMSIRIWAKEIANLGISYDFLGQRILDRCMFLLDLEPCTVDQSYDQFETDLSRWVHGFQSEMTMNPAAPKRLSRVVINTKLFVTDGSSLLHLRAAVSCYRDRAEWRRDGFKAIRSALGIVSQDIGCGVRAALVHDISSSLKHCGQDYMLQSSSAATPSKDLVTVEHYLSGLYGISKALRLEVQGAFNSLYACLTEELSACDYTEDESYQLCLLNCLGVRILEQDHTMLSRINFFFTLQELLDNALALVSETSVSSHRLSLADPDAEMAPATTNSNMVVQAAMKLFILMALQVATSRDADPHSSIANSVSLLNSGGSLQQAPLLRKIQSGPATLSKSVFDILYSQLSEVSNSLYSVASACNPSQYFIPTLFISQSVELVVSEAATLLLCVSQNKVCQALLLRPKWLTLLLQMVTLSTSSCQQKALLLLSDLLLAMDLDQLESEWQPFSIALWDGEGSPSEVDCGDVHSFATTVVCVIMRLIGRVLFNDGSTPLVVNESSDLAKEMENHSLPVISEAVALIRSLYCSSKWSKTVEAVLLANMRTFRSGKSEQSSLEALFENRKDVQALIATFCVFGSHIDAPYLNSPVMFQYSAVNDTLKARDVNLFSGGKDLHVGIFSSFHDSTDKIQITFYPSGEGASAESKDDVAVVLRPVIAIVPLDKVKAINRCPVQKVNFSDEVVVELVNLMNFLLFQVTPVNPTGGIKPFKETLQSKKEEGPDTILIEEKEEEAIEDTPVPWYTRCSFTSNVFELLKTSCAKAVATLTKDRKSLDGLQRAALGLRQDASPAFLRSLLQWAQEPNQSGGLLDLEVYEEYVMLTMKHRQKIWALQKQSDFEARLKKLRDAEKKTDVAESKAQTKEGSESGKKSDNAKGGKSSFEVDTKSDRKGDKSSEITAVFSPRDFHGNEINGEILEFVEYQGGSEDTGHSLLVDSLSGMGFPRRWCEIALDMCGSDPEEALNYILSNGVHLEELAMSLEQAEMQNQEQGNQRRSQVPNVREASAAQQSSNRGAGTANGAPSQDAPKTNLQKQQELLQNFSSICHYDGSTDKLLPFYEQPDFDSERLGCVYPGDDISVIEVRVDANDSKNVWYKLPYADFDDGNFQAAFGDDVYDVFVWVPRFYKGREVVREGPFEGDPDNSFTTPSGDSITVNKVYKIVGMNGALVREGAEINTPEVHSIKSGELIHAVEENFNSEGTLRLRLVKPVSGWVSKLFGLVEKVKDPEVIKKVVGSPTVEENAGTKNVALSEVELLEKVDDNMEMLSSSDAYSKSERFFGSMQGNQFLRYRDVERSMTQERYNRRMRVSGSSSIHSYLQGSSMSNLSLAGTDSIIARVLRILQLLYCRKVMMALLLENPASRSGEPTNDSIDLSSALSQKFPSVIEAMLLEKTTKEDNLSTSDAKDSSVALKTKDNVPKLFLTLLRMLVFRGEPYSYTGMEMLAVTEIFSFTVEPGTITAEVIIGNVLSIVLGKPTTSDSAVSSFRAGLLTALVESVARNIRLACASKYSDHVWADSSYEEDLDEELKEQPNIHFAHWVTRIVLQVSQDYGAIESLFHFWGISLRGSSMSLKNMAFGILTEMLACIRLRVNLESGGAEWKRLLGVCLQSLSLARLKRIGTTRLWFEMEDAPAYSRFLQSMLHLLSEIEVCQEVLSATQSNSVITDAPKTTETSAEGAKTEESVERPLLSRAVISLKPTNSYIQLSPQKDLGGSWTVEFWLNRRENPVHTPDPTTIIEEKTTSPTPVEIRNKPEREENTLGSLLDKLLGGKERGAAATELSGGKPQGSFPSLPAMHLMSAGKNFIKLQNGGRVFEGTESFDHAVDDSPATDETIPSEAFCIALSSQQGPGFKTFDAVIPPDKWVHLAITCQSSPFSLMNLYVDGELQDSMPYSMNLPVGTIGSMQAGSSFHGDLAEFRMWAVARSAQELRRDMFIKVNGASNLLAHLSCKEGQGSLTWDHGGYFNACKLHNCEWSVKEAPVMKKSSIPAFMVEEPEESEDCFGNAVGGQFPVIEATGLLSIKPVLGAQGELASNLTDVVCLCYRFLDDETVSDGTRRIEGYLNWCERDVRSRIQGTIAADKTVKFTIPPDSTVLGSSEQLSWLQELTFEGKLEEGQLKGTTAVSVVLDDLPPLSPGSSRVDKFSVPIAHVNYSQGIQSSGIAGRAMIVTEILTVKDSSDEGQYVTTVEVAPYPPTVEEETSSPSAAVSAPSTPTRDVPVVEEAKSSRSLAPRDRADQTKTLIREPSYGICANEGALWLEWKLQNNSENIGFGACIEDALAHPDASVDANEDTWAYSIAGQASHGADLFLCDVAEKNDLISVHIDTNTRSNGVQGSITFYKNYKYLVHFDGLNTHPAMTVTGTPLPFSRGIRPFVSLVSPADQVTYLGLKVGEVNLSFPDSDPRGRSKFCCTLVNGSFHGHGLTELWSGDSWFGQWSNGAETGLHVRLGSETAFARRYSKGQLVEEFHGEIAELQEEYSRLCRLGQSFTRKRVGNLITGSTVDEESPFPASSTPGSRSGDNTNKINIVIHDSSGENSYYRTQRTAPLMKLLEAYAVKRGMPVTSYVFSTGGRELPLEEPGVADPRTIESCAIEHESVIEAQVRSFVCTGGENQDGLFNTDIETFISKSQAPFVLQIIYEAGATVRNGVEIEECAAVRTLRYGEIIEAFQKSFTSEGIGRYNIADGWISEKLRGGSEAKVVRILRENFVNKYGRRRGALYYKVVREEGARVRSSASLSSSDIGFCPCGTVITVEESRAVNTEKVSIEVASSCATHRVRIAAPEEWKGWASNKEHILQLVATPLDQDSAGGSIALSEDPAIFAELSRRTRIQAQRKMKGELSNKSAAANNKLARRRVATAIGELSVSDETFFLLRRRKPGSSIMSTSAKISSDCTTVTCDESGGSRTLVLGSRGFTRGMHYWEVQVDAANWGSVFIGVAPEESSNWNGYGLLNYRATQAFGNETLYGSYFSVNDKVGVLLDMDHGTISFFKDGDDFNVGKVRVINMGVAYHNLRRVGQRHSNVARLFPCLGVKSTGDQLSLRRSHWISSKGLDSHTLMEQKLKAKHLMYHWYEAYRKRSFLPSPIAAKIYNGYQKWNEPGVILVSSRPGVEVLIDTRPKAIEAAVGPEIFHKYVLHAGANVTTQYGAGKLVGARKHQLWYHNEDAESKESGAAWYWRRDEIPDLLGAGIIRFYPKPSSSSTPQGTEVTVSVERPRVLSQQEFLGILAGGSSGNSERVWSVEEDARICQMVDYLSQHLDRSPLRLEATHIQQRANILKLSGRSWEEIHVRYVALCALNRAVSQVLPLLDLNNGDNREPVVSTTLPPFSNPFRAPTISRQTQPFFPFSGTTFFSGSTLLAIKKAVFRRTKMEVWNIAIRETTTPTSAPPDEYERPEDLREVTVNRLEARSAERLKDTISFQEKLRVSVFGQLMVHMTSWDERSLRRAFVHMQDAGQPRAFFVKFSGEGVDDQGGPYRAVFQTAVGEEPINLLDLFIPCANAAADVGENRDKYVVNMELSQNLSQFSSVFSHLGKMVGLACRHNIQVPLALPNLFWKPLAGEPVELSDLQAIDSTVINSLNAICSDEMSNEQVGELLVQALHGACVNRYGMNMMGTGATTLNMGGSLGFITLSNIQKIVTKALENRRTEHNEKEEKDGNSTITTESIVGLIEQLHLTAQGEGIKHVYKGLSAVVPIELLRLFTAEELEGLFCGEAEVDIDVLQKAAQYEGVSPTDSHIEYFWQALREMNKDELSQLINFCCGRSRLPAAASEFPIPFKLTSPPVYSDKHPDKYLPVARTCFFSLSLPKYSSVEVCLEKLRYAVRNTELMDADFIDRRGTSGWENVR